MAWRTRILVHENLSQSLRSRNLVLVVAFSLLSQFLHTSHQTPQLLSLFWRIQWRLFHSPLFQPPFSGISLQLCPAFSLFNHFFHVVWPFLWSVNLTFPGPEQTSLIFCSISVSTRSPRFFAFSSGFACFPSLFLLIFSFLFAVCLCIALILQFCVLDCGVWALFVVSSSRNWGRHRCFRL